jgi:hypothetical protein
MGSRYESGNAALQLGFQESPEIHRNSRILHYPLGMGARAALTAVLLVVVIAVAIRCAGLGVVNVGAIVPPMPLKTTPEGYDGDPAPRRTYTPTPSATRTPMPTPVAPTPNPGEPEPLPEPPPIP